MKKISVAIATYNEESNLDACLKSVKNFVDEIIIVDGSSTDKTVDIAKKYSAKVIVTDNPPIFHINKQKAMDIATGEWILQLDADEIVSKELASEIKHIISLSNTEIEEYQNKIPKKNLFYRHKQLIELRDGQVGKRTGEYAAFFIPRLNFFLGKYLHHGGVYPDGIIRLLKKGKAYLPCKDVHEQMIVDGKVGWLQQPLYHRDSPTFNRYMSRNNRYIELLAKQLHEDKVKINAVNAFRYFGLKPVSWFVMTQLRHKGILDGWQGVVFSLFSALRFPRAYYRYSTRRKKSDD